MSDERLTVDQMHDRIIAYENMCKDYQKQLAERDELLSQARDNAAMAFDNAVKAEKCARQSQEILNHYMAIYAENDRYFHDFTQWLECRYHIDMSRAMKEYDAERFRKAN